jgi:hypothetical protein
VTNLWASTCYMCVLFLVTSLWRRICKRRCDALYIYIYIYIYLYKYVPARCCRFIGCVRALCAGVANYVCVCASCVGAASGWCDGWLASSAMRTLRVTRQRATESAAAKLARSQLPPAARGATNVACGGEVSRAVRYFAEFLKPRTHPHASTVVSICEVIIIIQI